MDSDNEPAVDVSTGSLTEGVTIVMRNTLEEGAPEGSFPSRFGAPDDAFDESATLSFTTAEYPTALMQLGTAVGDIPGRYLIDFTDSRISFAVLPAADNAVWRGVADVFGVFPAGKFARYSFTFSSEHNKGGFSGSKAP